MTKRSQGAVLLARSGHVQEDIATSVGTTRASVSYWMNGSIKPRAEKRTVLREVYGIPEASWDEPPAKIPKEKSVSRAVSPVPAAVPPPPAATAPLPSDVMGKVAVLEQMAHDLMVKVRTDPGATPIEQARVMASIAQTLHLLAKVTGQLELGAKLFKLPIWKRIEKAIDRGLTGFPEAAASVARELRALDDEHSHAG